MSLEGNLKPGQQLSGSINSIRLLTVTAYGIAVKNGFKGTEEEWLLSLEANPETIKRYVNEYLEQNPTTVDTTLTKEGEAADAKATGEAIQSAKKEAKDHADSQTNPHNVTKDQVGLGNADNTSDMDKPVSVAQAEAIANVAALANEKATTETYKGTLTSSGWSGSAPFTQTVTISGLLSTDYPFVDIDLSNVSNAQSVIEAWNMVGRVTVSGNNTVVAYCYEEKPTVDIPIVFKVVR